MSETSATIIGAAGGIGASVTTELVRQGLFDVLHLVDVRTNVLEADRIDLRESAVVAGGVPPRITVHDPHSARELDRPSDLVICAATLGERPGRSRSSFAATNWELLESLAEPIRHAAGESGMVLVITNPIDAMAARLARAVGMRDRIIGYSLNDSTRLRLAVADELGVTPDRVHAEALGVHGEELVPAFSRVRVDGEPVELAPEQRVRVVEAMDGWWERWHALNSGRSSTRSTAAGVAASVTAMRQGRTLPMSVATDGIDYLPDDAFVGYPTSFAGGRAAPDTEVDLAGAERAELSAAAESVRRLADSLG
ncbi:lactate/malate family dehydrogenase [Georgenia alba]|uniref:Malate dehydrogenase n=1 Tax=Georgenia alba TaxID=2233858 RepID=A0ABW2QAI8_9MICO